MRGQRRGREKKSPRSVCRKEKRIHKERDTGDSDDFTWLAIMAAGRNQEPSSITLSAVYLLYYIIKGRITPHF